MRFLRENLGLKLMALALSIALWANVKLHQEPLTAALPLRLEVKGLSDELVATSGVSQVTVVIYGPKSYVSALTPEDITAFVDLEGAVPGLNRENVVVSVPRRLQPVLNIQSATPSQVEVQVREKARRTVPVRVDWVGAPVAGARYGDTQVMPSTVAVAGGDMVVEQVAYAQVKVPTGDPHISGRFPVVPVNEAGEPVADVSVWPTSARVEATLTPIQSRRQAFVSPRFEGTLAPGFQRVQVETQPQVVTLVGPPDVLATLKSVPTRPIDLSGARNSVDRTVELSLPPGVTPVPDRVLVRVRIRKADQQP